VLNNRKSYSGFQFMNSSQALYIRQSAQPFRHLRTNKHFILWQTLCHDRFHISATVRLRVRDGAVGCGTAVQAGWSRVRFPMVSLGFFFAFILPAALGPFGWLRYQNKPGPVRRADNLATFTCRYSEFLVASSSWSPKACPGLYRDCFTFT
jgi:hypothetical protein